MEAPSVHRGGEMPKATLGLVNHDVEMRSRRAALIP